MPNPYIGEIRMFGGNFAPQGWMMCEGQLLPISGNDALFQLIGTTYGGDGQTTFALPDLRGRLVVHLGGGFTQGESAGAEQVTLTTNEIPSHTHTLVVSANNAGATSPTGRVLAQTPTYTPYIASPANLSLAAGSVGSDGGSQPHTNFHPYLCVNFIISLFGVFPTHP